MSVLPTAWVRAAAALLMALSALLAAPAHAQAPSPGAALTTCTGRFANPVTDVCWSCIFPITFGVQLPFGSGLDIPDDNPPPFCFCPPIRPGIGFGMWEPVRQVDVTRKPFCLVGLGLDLGFLAGTAGQLLPVPEHSRMGHTSKGYSSSFYHAHWYANPLLYLLQLVIDFACVSTGGFDLLYMTEFDPTWSNDELASIMNPEAILFSNIFVQASCAVDCAAATFVMPVPLMSWCAGCNGPTFPLDGWVTAHQGGVQAASLITQRLHHKLQRMGIEWTHHTPAAACGPFPQPLIIDKLAFKTQLQYPLPQTTKAPFCCNWFGSTTVLSGLGAEIPVAGEDFSFMMFRKRSCCAL